MQPRCKICGHFISEHDLWETESVECCKIHGFIKICGPCLELFETYKEEDEACIIMFVREYRPLLNPMFHARHACPECDYISFTFSATSNHMFRENHRFQRIGTYPLFRAPSLRPNLIPHNTDALMELARQGCISTTTEVRE